MLALTPFAIGGAISFIGGAVGGVLSSSRSKQLRKAKTQQESARIQRSTELYSEVERLRDSLPKEIVGRQSRRGLLGFLND